MCEYFLKISKSNKHGSKMRISPFFERGFKPVSLYDKHRTSQPRTSGSLGPAKMELSQNVRRQQYFHDNLDIFDGPMGSVIKKYLQSSV